MADAFDLLDQFGPSFSVGGASARVLKKKKKPALTDADFNLEEDPSFLSQIGNVAAGGFETLGSILDTPGSFVRNIAAGRNPLPGLYDTSQRASGRDIWETWGMAPKNKPGFHPLDDPADALWDVLGFGTEVVTDPLTALGLAGAGAYAKTGRALKKAGLMQDTARLVSKGKNLRGAARLGAVEARTVGTGEDILKGIEAFKGATAAQAAKAKIADAAKIPLAEVDDLLKGPLGGPVNWKVPFTDIEYTPRGAWAQKVAKGEDLAKTFLRWNKYSPVRPLVELLHAPARGMKTPEVGRHATRLFNEEPEIAAAARQEVAQQIPLFARSKVLDPKNLEESRNVFEGYKALPAGTPEAAAVEGFRKGNELDLALDQAAGLTVGELHNYWPRFIPYNLTKKGTGTGGKALSGHFASAIKRTAPIHDLPAAKLMEFAKRPEVRDFFAGRTLGHEPSLEEATKWLTDNKWFGPGGVFPDTYTIIKRGKAIDKPRLKPFAKLFANMPEETMKVGIYGNAPLEDLLLSRTGRRIARSRAQGVYDILAEEGWVDTLPKLQTKPIGTAIRKGTTVQTASAAHAPGVGQVLDNTNGLVTVDLVDEAGKRSVVTMPEGLLQRVSGKVEGPARKLPTVHSTLTGLGIDAQRGAVNLLKLTGKPVTKQNLARVLHAPLEKRHIEDLTRVVTSGAPPEAAKGVLSAYDTATNLTKAWLTSMATNPAFASRNLSSGQIENLLRGLFGSQTKAQQMVTGKPIQGVENWPLVKRTLQEQGRAVTNQEANKLLREMAFAHKITGPHMMEAAQVAGGTKGVGTTMEDLLSQMPGEVPVSLKGFVSGAGKEGAWKPWNVRGVMGKERSTFYPQVIGERANEWVESQNRLSPWLKQIEQGVDWGEAARKVGESQVNYQARNWTPLERDVLSRIFPFWKFTKAKTTDIAKQILQRPGGPYAQTIRGVRGMRAPGSFLPDYVAESLAVPIPYGTPLIGPKNPEDQRYITATNTMMEDPLSFLSGGVRGAGNELLSRLNPILKGPLEHVVGTSFFQKGPLGGRHLEDLDPTVGRTIANVKELVTGERQRDASYLPLWLEELLANSPASRILSQTRTLVDPRKQALIKATNLLTGGRMTDVPEQTREAVMRENLQKLMRTIGGSKVFERVYVPKAALEKMSPEDAADAKKLQAVLNMLAKKARERAKAAAMAETP